MSNIEYPKGLKGTIDILSQEKSYQSVCHRHYPDQPMPSVYIMEEIVDLIREIIFPGYFGNSPTVREVFSIT
ncbi:hypothetical protein [Geofilum rubicundum]|uniref:Serine acetyltransferase n=1 Tax=Geofilum rubicundum JCM 15548 TaxID=1236989 RepID=A0A0E9LTK9_9BACT|nr:hypothetical protein [Geofilum rubicundum]GAO28633.1 serine acetyltransferase [Geofilum rubicundum JCM 15548]